LGSLLVTHPFHALSGERLVIVSERRFAGERVYLCEGGVLGAVTVREDATDRGPEPTARPLTVEVLADLLAARRALGGGAQVGKDR
jgi:Family of unknown function (DUF5372)